MVIRIFVSASLLAFSTEIFSKPLKKISIQELSKHNLPKDCWLEIDGKVYDVSGFAEEHKVSHDYDYAKWCGQAASEAWSDKDGRARRHNRKAHLILKRYLIGEK